MDLHADNHDNAELGAVEGLLRAERDELSASELDQLRQRVHGRVTSTPRPRRKAPIMKSRLALVAMLTVGMLMSLSGVGLAVSALSDDDSAAVSQYGTTGDSNVLGAEEGGGDGDSNVAGVQEDDPPVAGTAAQGGASDDDNLPFTGFAAIPLLLGGVALLTTGVVLRRRASDV